MANTEEKLIVRSARLIPGGKIGRLTASYATATIEEPDLYSEEGLGQIGVVIEILGDTRKSADVAQQIVKLAGEYFISDKDSPDPSQQFTSTIKRLNEELYRLADRYNGWVGKTSAGIAAITNSAVYVTGTGSAEVYLHRNHRLHKLTVTSKQGSTDKIFADYISGPLQEGDKIFLTTPGIWQQISKERLNELLVKGPDPASIVGEIAEIIRPQSRSERIAVIISEVVSASSALAQPMTAQPEPEDHRIIIPPAKDILGAQLQLLKKGRQIIKDGAAISAKVIRKQAEKLRKK